MSQKNEKKLILFDLSQLKTDPFVLFKPKTKKNHT